MIRLHAVVEGQTEETFVRDVLAPEFGAQNVFVDAHRITTGRKRLHIFRGGMSGYARLKSDLTLWMKQDRHPDAWFTTMIDFYGLPEDFPGYRECAGRGDPIARVECLEERLQQDIPHRKFIPYIQLHEFEALLFSEPDTFESVFPGDSAAIQQLIAIRGEFPTPEYINDRPDLAPSKRIMQLLPDYRKPLAGPLIIQEIGLPTLRRECLHFNQWIGKIEKAASQ